MDGFKRVIIFLLAGIILGAVASTFMASGYLVWDNTTSVGGQQTVDLPLVTRQTINSLVRWQLIGAAIGAGVGLIVGLLTLRRRKTLAAGAASATTTTGTPGGTGTLPPPSTPAI